MTTTARPAPRGAVPAGPDPEHRVTCDFCTQSHPVAVVWTVPLDETSRRALCQPCLEAIHAVTRQGLTPEQARAALQRTQDRAETPAPEETP